MLDGAVRLPLVYNYFQLQNIIIQIYTYEPVNNISEINNI